MEMNLSGHRIRVGRALPNPELKQEELVARLQLEGIKINKNAISQIEKGKRKVSDIELVTIARVLGVTTAWLLGETNDPGQR